ncbi:MAG: hypothetical protein NTW79_00995 [Candidatus Berkelbacteria bacterium]|nr:hypothetical protein [Candidatus Berkelbacteria bacterium]
METGENEPAKVNFKPRRNLLWLWILIPLVVIGGGVAVYAYRGPIKDKFWPKKTATSSSTTASTASTKIVDDGITWLNPRVKLADLGLFKGQAPADAAGEGYVGTSYYKVATTSDGSEIILAVVSVKEMGTFDDIHHFLKKNGVYYWLSENSDAVGGGGDYYSRTGSQTDSTFVIKSLQLDKTFTKGSTNMIQQTTDSHNDTFVVDTTVGTKVDETKWGDLYLWQSTEITKSVGNAKVALYYILRNDGIRMIYWPDPSFRGDDGSLNADWTNSAGQSDKFSQISVSGCGAVGGTFPLIIDNASLQSKIQIGTAGNTGIYTFPSTSTMVDFGYQVYLMDLNPTKVSKETFAGNLGIIAIQDGYGNWAAFLNENYRPQAECGKPVIYLYPTKRENVSVKVGADIRKSDPIYNGGWNVLADPTGSLNIAGKIYDSLFWEGTGWGKYPEITSGTVVKSSEVSATISNQLSSMGLNNKEISDFKDFWLPKMPATPYVRLTWLTNNQMNILAPLAVSPKPDSEIRVFLDFEGLSSPINITQQILPKYQRSGFTLVEWGGLLRIKNN